MIRLILFMFYIGSQNLWATVISHSGVEVEYSYNAEFRSLYDTTNESLVEARDLAQKHAAHIFGVFNSAEVAKQYGFPTELTEGFAGTKIPNVIRATFVTRAKDNRLWVRYEARARALILRPMAEQLFRKSSAVKINFPLPLDMTAIYLDDGLDYSNPSLTKCTDPNLPMAEEFYYFHNPYRCPTLGRAPIGQQIEFRIQLLENRLAAREVVPLRKLRANNNNGRLVNLYFTFGFDGAPTNQREIEKDLNWAQFAGLEKYLTKHNGFVRVDSTEDLRKLLGVDFSTLNLQTPVTLSHGSQKRFFRTYVRVDKQMTWVVRSALLATDNEELSSPLYSFPKYWKESWENGDFIYFGGHSGLGQSLRLSTMLKTLKSAEVDRIRFDASKTQVAFFDSCSSYAHFVDMYFAHKKKNLDILSYGMMSLFHLAEPTITSTLNLLLNESEEPTWAQTLERMESEQLRPHVEFLYNQPYAEKVYKTYQRKQLYPSFLLNVTTD